jgi:hypothetical protein
MSFEWLPELLLFTDYHGDWEIYVEEIYRIFKKDFINHRVFFRGKIINIRKTPLSRGKEITFWHLISAGNIEEERTPDLRRCERIKWPRFIIENETRREIKVWEKKHKRDLRICLLIEEEKYIIILNKRVNKSNDYEYILLLTAYHIEKKHHIRKLLNEYQRYKND